MMKGKHLWAGLGRVCITNSNKNNMNGELEQLQALTLGSSLPDEVKEDLLVFFSGLEVQELSGILELCQEDIVNLAFVAELLERRKAALIKGDPETWEEVLSFEEALIEREERAKEEGKML
jgi:hypothetical protein